MYKKAIVLLILLLVILSLPVHTDTPGRTYYEIEFQGNNYFRHIIQPGDTLYELSLQFKVDLDTLLELNPDIDPQNLSVGEEIIININDRELDYYITLPFDSLWKFAQIHNLNYRSIAHFNNIDNPDHLLQNEVIRLPENIFTARNKSFKIIDFNSQENHLRISGLARVFEAHVSYTLETESGQILNRGGTTASTAGPHWGSFVIELDDIPEETDFISIFAVSMKDGSRQDELKLRL